MVRTETSSSSASSAAVWPPRVWRSRRRESSREARMHASYPNRTSHGRFVPRTRIGASICRVTEPDAADERAPSDDPAATGFAALGLDERLLRTLTALGYEEPTPVQQAAIPPLLAGKDLLAEAPTGTGKTAAFALPILQRLAVRLDEERAAGRPVDGRGAPKDGRGSRPSALVLAPTRELAMQVAEAIHKYGKELGVRVVPVYGGQPITTQLHRLARGVDVVVATPGRAVDHLDRGTLRFDEVETVVLDEADEMLDMGFADDLEKILGALRELRQTALFSATIAGPIARLAARHLRHPVRVQVEAEAT